MERRLTSTEVNLTFQKSNVDDLRTDLRMMQGNIKIDLERIQVSLHKDIKTIQDTLNAIARQQAVEEARLNASVGIGKWLVEKMPWILAVGASLAAGIQIIRDKTP